MKVIRYQRFAQSSIHIHASSNATCFYVPELKCIVGIEQHGTFGGSDNYITRDPDILKEGAQAEALASSEGAFGLYDNAVQICTVRVLNPDEMLVKGLVESLDMLVSSRVKSEEQMQKLNDYARVGK